MITVRLPRRWRLVDRDKFILSHCKGRRVLHLGCTDAPFHAQQAKSGRLLHKKLLVGASSVIGVDIDAEALEWLKAHLGEGEYRLADLEISGALDDLSSREIDVIVLTDVIEHMNNAGRALQHIRSVAGAGAIFIVTAPNAFSIKAMIRVFFGRELVHPDHVAYYSPYTLANLLKRHGWEPIDHFFYAGGGTGVMAKAMKLFLWLRPACAEGVGIVCKPSQE